MIALMTAGCMVFCTCGCGNTETVSPGTTDIPIIIEEDDAPDADHGNADHADADDTGVNDNGMSDAESDGTGSDTSDAVEPAIDSATLSFTEFKNLTFEFSSGAGGWATQLSIHSDGTFAGEYFDSDMGS